MLMSGVLVTSLVALTKYRKKSIKARKGSFWLVVWDGIWSIMAGVWAAVHTAFTLGQVGEVDAGSQPLLLLFSFSPFNSAPESTQAMRGATTHTQSAFSSPLSLSGNSCKNIQRYVIQVILIPGKAIINIGPSSRGLHVEGWRNVWQFHSLLAFAASVETCLHRKFTAEMRV